MERTYTGEQGQSYGSGGAKTPLDVLFRASTILQNRKFPVAAHADQRAIGDCLEGEAREIARLVAAETLVNFRPAASRRTLEDFRLETGKHALFADVKTRNLGASFSMPNLASITRIRKLYANPAQELAFLFIEYSRNGSNLQVVSAEPRLLHEICWTSLHIQNLGLGQLQLRNARETPARTDQGRTAWLETLTEHAQEFCRAQSLKFERELQKWQDHGTRAKATPA